jgi:EpsI family protein
MVRRAAIVVVLLVAVRFYSAHVVSAEVVVPREPLASLPLVLGDWEGHEAPPLADDVLTQLGVDDYVNREYMKGATIPVGLYVGYYASQRQGDTIHSPQNCLPGAGWGPVETGIADLQVGGRTVRVNQFVIQKGLDRQLVLYWYQGRGRVVANEYTNKALLMLDAARLHRTNGGLVRLITPIETTAGDAKAALTSFAVTLFPHLDKRLP